MRKLFFFAGIEKITWDREMPRKKGRKGANLSFHRFMVSELR
jgi:hypothetical protein